MTTGAWSLVPTSAWTTQAVALAARATACVVQADVGTSDHAPVVMTV